MERRDPIQNYEELSDSFEAASSRCVQTFKAQGWKEIDLGCSYGLVYILVCAQARQFASL